MGATKRINDRITTKSKAIAKPPNIKKRKNIVPFIPDELIFHILVRISADILYNTMRCVCKQWYNIIKDPLFIREQVSAHSRYVGMGFHCINEATVYFAHFGREKATLSKLMTLPSSKSEVFSICDGLILFRCEILDKVFVANPLTKQLVTLPPINPLSTSVIYRLSRVGSSLEYKVVFFCYYEGLKGTVCGVFTLGKDKSWRIHNFPWTYPGCVHMIFNWPVKNGKYIHWTGASCSGMVTFDMESELICISRVPKAYFINDKCSKYKFLVRGGYVTFMIGLHGNTVWEVWTLSHRTSGEWKKLFVIDFRPEKCQIGRISKLFCKGGFFPVAWIDDDVLVFRDHLWPFSFIYHNIKTGYTYQLMSRHYHSRSYGVYSPYASSLVSLS